MINIRDQSIYGLVLLVCIYSGWIFGIPGLIIVRNGKMHGKNRRER
jgi:hypothetical protein